MTKLTAVGAGYVGLVTSVCLAELGHEILVVDKDADRIDLLKEGRAPFHEPGLEESIFNFRDRLQFSSDPLRALTASDCVLVCVDTPSKQDGSADLDQVWNVIEQLPTEGSPLLVIMKSTVPVGTGARIQEQLLLTGRGHHRYCSNPEFLREGSALADFMNPDRIVIGADDPTTRGKVAELYRGVSGEVVMTDVRSAEMAKYASNAFLAARISLINEIANICDVLGADVRMVARAVGLDKRIGPHFLEAGIGYGGSCLPKDLAALRSLAEQAGYRADLLGAVAEVNNCQVDRSLAKLRRLLKGQVAGSRVALLGLAFKPDTDDVRAAPACALATRLLCEGSSVVAYDPEARENFRSSARELERVDYVDSALEALRGADAAILVTPWREFAALDWVQAKGIMRRPVILDARNALVDAGLPELGFIYEGIGIANGGLVT